MGSGGEQWRGVPGFQAAYQVSSLGRVRSLPRMVRHQRGLRRHGGKLMTPVLDKDGYPRVILRIDGKYHTRKVHRLVCEAFNGPPNILHREVHHIDNDRANARADNLRWVSHSENMFHAKWERNPAAYSRLTPCAVREIRSAKGVKRASELAAWFGVKPYTIYDIWKGKRWSALP